MVRKILWGTLIGALLSGCGAEDSQSTAPASGDMTSLSPARTPNCATQAQSNQPYTCNFATSLGGEVTWSLEGNPEGMRIQPSSGALTWTPSQGQTGQYSVAAIVSNGSQSETFKIKVRGTVGGNDPAGLYVSPVGNDSNAGTSGAPLASLKEAAKRVQPGQTIFLRGGVYYNSQYGTDWSRRSEGSLARFQTSGTASQPITIRNFGNEYPKLVSDVTAIALNDVSHYIIEDLEIEGGAQALDEATIMNQWWAPDGRQTGGRGITGQFDHVTIRNNVIHDFPGAGISNDEGEYLTIEDNIVYNNASWATGGVQGIALTGLSSTGESDEFSIQVNRNLVMGNQSLIISHVFSKGYVTLTVDEGHGILVQDTTNTFEKAALIEHNLGLFNGKACIAMNRFDKATIRYNSCYLNSRVVPEAGEVVRNNSFGESVYDNIFHPRSDRETFKLLPKEAGGFGRNATLAGILGDIYLPPQTLLFQSVFSAPAMLNFTPVTSMPTGMGANMSTVAWLLARAKEFGVAIQPPPQPLTEAMVQAQRVHIFATWPADKSGIVLIDKPTGHEWNYNQRCHYPNWPAPEDC